MPTMTRLLDRSPASRRSSAETAGADRAALAWGPVLVVVGVKLAVNLVVSGRYGWHRDELYYADAGRHPALGHVDFPPVTPLLAALARIAFADSLVGLRLLASLAGAGVIVVTAALCRDLGGSRRAQVVAAVCITPLVVGSNAMFQTVSFDQLTWAVLLWAVVRLLRAPSDRAWVLVGAAVALAWQTKYTVGVLLAALAVGLLVTGRGREALRSWGPLLAAAVFALVAAPNLWWQATHDWASVDFLAGRGDVVRDEYPPIAFVAELVVLTGVVSLPLAILGIRRLVRDRAQRSVGIAVVLVPLLALAMGGKGYYAAPVAVAAFAAGAAALDGTAGWRRTYGRVLPALVVAGGVLASPMIVPVLPRSLAASTGVAEARDDWANELGWPELTADVARAWRSLPPDARADTAVVASNYGVAGALTRFGPARGLDAPVVSGHLTWAMWELPDDGGDRHRVLAVGFDGPAPDWCGTPRRVGRVVGLDDVDTEEAGTPIWSCRLAGTVADLRPALRRLA